MIYTSLCVIAGNESMIEVDGKPIIERMLLSVLKRSGGSLVDEIVISWNGTTSHKSGLESVVQRARSSFQSVEIKLIERPWDGNFAAARQHSFEAASGVWRGFLDTDDVVPDRHHPAIAESLKLDGVVLPPESEESEGKTLNDYLRSLDKRVNAIWWRYHYIIGSKGEALQRTWHSRFVRWEDGWAWSEAVHEDMVPIRGNVAVMAWNSALPILHYPVVSNENRNKRNLAILKEMESRSMLNGTTMPDYRLLYGIGTGYHDLGEHKLSIDYLQQAATCALSTVDRVQAILVSIESHIAMGDLDGATKAALMAVNYAPQISEPYYALSECRYNAGDWANSVYWYEVGRSKDESGCRQVSLIIDNTARRDVWSRVCAATSYLRLGNAQRASVLAKEAWALREGDPAVLEVLREAEKANLKERAVSGCVSLAEYLVDSDEMHRATDLVNLIPEEIGVNQQIRAIVQSIRSSKSIRSLPNPAGDPAAKDAFSKDLGSDYQAFSEWASRDLGPDAKFSVIEPCNSPGTTPGIFAVKPEAIISRYSHKRRIQSLEIKKDKTGTPWTVAAIGPIKNGTGPTTSVAIFAPIHIEQWGPLNPSTIGIGAAEESIVYMAELVAKKTTFDITVFAPIQSSDLHFHNGVRWRHLKEFDHRKKYDVLISHRSPWLLKQPDIGASRVIVWHQDNAYPTEAWGPRLAARSEHVFVSEFQKHRLLEGIDEETIASRVIHNAVPDGHTLGGYKGTIPPRDPHRCIWASNPSRGLTYLLDVWPTIRSRVPDATLDIYYGWEVLMAVAVNNGNLLLLNQRESLEKKIKALSKFGVKWIGRINHELLTQEFMKSGVLPYSCFSFEEGYGVSVARAIAAGCIPVLPNTGALTEIYPTQGYRIGEHWDSGGKTQLIEDILKAMGDTQYDRTNAWKTVDLWSKVSEQWIDVIHDGIYPASPPAELPKSPEILFLPPIPP